MNKVLPNPSLTVDGSALRVVVKREAFTDFFVLSLPDGTSEELETDPCKAWFKERGANMDAVDKALDHCWNFYYVEIVIRNPLDPRKKRAAYEPDL